MNLAYDGHIFRWQRVGGVSRYFREVISRYAEMRQVSHRDNPGVMQFLAPGLTKVWEQHYIPHLERVYQDVVAHQKTRAVEGISGQIYNIPDDPNVQVRSLRDDQPKIDERALPTGSPVGAQADASSAPHNKVLASSIEMNPNTLAALNALKGMGVSQ